MKKKYRNIVFLTGAGISAESRLATFRGNGGLWNGCNPDDVATLGGFKKNREAALSFYNNLRREALNAEPNAAHLAITKLQQEYDGEVSILTQNVDTLHEKSHSKNVYHIHGRIDQSLCLNCSRAFETTEDVLPETVCPHCECSGSLRPDIVFFGEEIRFGKQAKELICKADLFIAVGTSGTIVPASKFAAEAKRKGARAVAFNLERLANLGDFHQFVAGKASVTLPKFVCGLLDGAPEIY